MSPVARSIAIGTLLLLPLSVFAQSNDLRASIRAEVMKDPRTAQMSPAEIDGLVDMLANGAQKQGVTAKDIAWQPRETQTAAAPSGGGSSCLGMPQFFCTVERSFGLDGSNPYIPVGLLATSGLLVFLLYELKHHHKLEARS
jgi:hypothetical protein